MVNKPFFAETQSVSDAVEAEPNTPPIIRPQGLAELHEQGIQGRGVTIAVIDSGIVEHEDFAGRIKHFKDFSTRGNRTPTDPVGHGTHVAGIAAGDGELIDGVAPGAELVGLRIQTPLEAIKALEWTVENKDKYSIDVINVSLGVEANLPSREDPFAQATQKAIDEGLVTVVASGNECFTTHCQGSISSPGTLADAITVGAYNDRGTADPHDDVMWGRSSQGPTAVDSIAKPDLVAQGVNIFAPSSPGSTFASNRPKWEAYHADQGSSMATPMVAGGAALLLQIDPELTQREIKQIFTETADSLDNVGPNAQGSGRLDLAEAVKRVLQS